jgi:parallel beta-helix repeat protein
MSEIDATAAGNRAQRRAAGRRSKKMMAVSSGAVLVAGVAGPGVLLSQSVASAATTFTVENLDDAGAGSLRQALLDADANAGEDVITFATGLSGAIVLESDLTDIDEAVAIVGPGAGVITVDGGGTVGNGDGSQIFYFDGVGDGTIAVSGLTLTGGYNDYGGAIRVYDSDADVILTDLVITSNEAEYYGGGVAIDTTGVAIVDNTEISDNLSDTGGGGLYADFDGDGGSLTITNSLITGNTSTDGQGGGLYVTGGDLLIENTTISGNEAADDGGGGVNFYGDAGLTFTLRNSTVSGNIANGYGGGLYVEGYGSTVIENSTISGNTANQAGAIYGGEAHSVTITQSTVTGNEANEPDAEPAVGGVQLAGGGGENVGTAKAAARGNAAKSSRPAAAGPGELEVVGTILAGNSGQDIGIYSNGDPSVTSDHSILGVVDPGVPVTDLGGTQLEVTDPGLDALAFNGGPTQTHALLDGSPALNAGPDPVPSFPGNEYDQRGPGFARVAFGLVDVGAFEAQEDEPVVPPPGPDTAPADAVVVTPAFTG